MTNRVPMPWLFLLGAVAGLLVFFEHRHGPVPLRPLPLRTGPAADVYAGGTGIDSQGWTAAVGQRRRS
jgi:hypothetical protein